MTATAELLRVSNSEAVTAAGCEQQWMYQYHPGYKLEAVNGNLSFDRGTAVHTVLEVFFRHLMETQDGSVDDDVRYTEAVKQAKHKFKMLIVENIGTELGTAIKELDVPFELYFKHRKAEILTWEILGVELELSAPVDGVLVVGRIDLLIKPKRGKHAGRTIPVDHKACFNFWSEKELEINSQGPIYAHLVKHNMPDAIVEYVYFNALRWRIVKDKEAMSKIVPLEVPKSLRAAYLRNHAKLARRIKRWEQLPVEEMREEATRTTNPYICKNCSMRRLCRAELTGQNTTEIIRYEYRHNTYLYVDQES